MHPPTFLQALYEFVQLWDHDGGVEVATLFASCWTIAAVVRRLLALLRDRELWRISYILRLMAPMFGSALFLIVVEQLVPVRDHLYEQSSSALLYHLGGIGFCALLPAAQRAVDDLLTLLLIGATNLKRSVEGLLRKGDVS